MVSKFLSRVVQGTRKCSPDRWKLYLHSTVFHLINTDPETLAYRRPLGMKSGLDHLFPSQGQTLQLLEPQDPISMVTELTIGTVRGLMGGKPSQSFSMHTT